MKANFKRAIQLVWEAEGGYVNDRYDPGGATKYGITRQTLSAWRGGKCSISDVKRLKRSEAEAIYKARYWDAVNADNLPSGLDFALFDFSVNSGPKRAAKFLQRIVGIRADGIVGGMTLAAVKRHQAEDVIERLNNNRWRFMRNLRHFWRFGKGWRRRVDAVRSEAQKMARADKSGRAYA